MKKDITLVVMAAGMGSYFGNSGGTAESLFFALSFGSGRFFR